MSIYSSDKQEEYKQEFEKCRLVKDYEEYIIKYYDASDNPYLKKAKQMLHIRTKYTFRKRLVWVLVILTTTILLNIPVFLDGESSLVGYVFIGIFDLVAILIAYAVLFNRVDG